MHEEDQATEHGDKQMNQQALQSPQGPKPWRVPKRSREHTNFMLTMALGDVLAALLDRSIPILESLPEERSSTQRKPTPDSYQ